MSENWQNYTLKQATNLITGFPFKSEKFTSLIDDMPLVKGSNLSHLKIDWVTAPRYPMQDLPDEKYKLKCGDIVIAMDRPIVGDRLKYAWISKSDPEAYLVQRMAVLRSKPETDQVFLRYIIGSESFKGYIESITTGANVPHISGGDIHEYKFSLPPLPTQQKIAAILSAYDDLIENNNKRIKLLEELAQITYEEWFVRMKFPNHENTPIDEATGLPVGWERKKLGDVASITMGQSPKSEFYNFTGEGLPFHQGVKDYGDRFIKNTCWSTEGSRLAYSGDILFSVRAPVGRLNISREKIILGRGLCAIRHNKDAQSFCYYMLKNKFFEEDMMGGGAIFNSVTKNDMLGIEVIQPTESLLMNYESIAGRMDAQILNLHEQNIRLKEARDLLLPRLMSGAIDVDSLTIPMETNP